jgi:hypothetical protein
MGEPGRYQRKQPCKEWLAEGEANLSNDWSQSGSLELVSIPNGNTFLEVVSYMLSHGPPKWNSQQHFVALGCGQSCGCCRSRCSDGFGSCEACDEGWELSCVSRSFLATTSKYGAQHLALYMHCRCGECKEDWLNDGLVCPQMLHNGVRCECFFRAVSMAYS